jgi:hypothetical protein
MAAVHGAVGRRAWQLGLFAGLAGAFKVIPILAVPALVAADWRFWRGRLAALTAWIAAGLAVGLAPMALASRAALGDFLRYHGGRGLQVESTLALLLGAATRLAGGRQRWAFSYGSFNLVGPVADALARAALPLTLAAIVGLTVWIARGADDGDDASRIERVTCAAVAAVVVLWLGGKVFSPQYLTWGIPLVLAIPGPRGLRACAAALVAMILTQVYHRGFYSELPDQNAVGLVTVIARQAVLVALLAGVAGAFGGKAMARAPAS